MYDLAAWSTESIEDSVQDLLALWTRTEFKPFLGHFYTLFSVARSGSQLYANTRLSAGLSMFDAATILGFVVTPAGIKRKNSADKTKQIEAKQIKDAGTPQKSVATKSLPAYLSGQPYSISAIPSLIAKFECDNPDFDAFKLLRGNTLKWFEAERAVARAIVESNKGRLTFGQKWSFFAHSKFVAQVTQKLSMRPQVIPKVKTKALELDEAALKEWATGSRQYPPQSTMTSASWHTLIKHLDMRRVIIPVEMSKSPDVLFVLRNTALLCFQVKTGTQDNSLAQLVTELAKCPYLSRPDVTKNKVVFSANAPETASVTFVYVAPVHAAIKAALMTEAVEFVKGNEKAATDAAVTKYFEYIHVKHGCKAINLPEKVEVIVLLRAGMEELFGEEYRTLLDPLCEVKSLEQEEILREQLRAKTEPLATTIEEVEEEAMRVFERVRNVPGAEDILAKKLKELFAVSKQK